MKPFFLFSIVLIWGFQCSIAQTAPLKKWDARFGGNQDDIPFSVLQTNDGGYILGGYSHSGISGDKTQASQGGYDYWILKIDSHGVKLWDVRFGGNNDDRLYSVQQTDDGGYILGGYSNSGINGDKTQEKRGSADYWIVKIDSTGIKQWDAAFGGSGSDYFSSLGQTNDGGYILGGYSSSGISGDKTQSSQGSSDFWIVKTDANGTKQWDARFGGSDIEYLHSVQQTADGGYILSGSSYSGISGDKSQASQGGGDYWIVKTDANGIKQWDARFGGSDTEGMGCLDQTVDGGYIVGGWSYSGIGGDRTESNQGSDDYWIVKMNVDGVKQWDARFGGESFDVLNSLQQTFEGGYILGGESFSGISGDKTEPNWDVSLSTPDYWIVKTDANGVKEWDKRFGGSGRDEILALDQTADGEYIFGGRSSSGISGDKTQDCWGDDDYWIVKTESKAAGCKIPFGLLTSNIKSASATLGWKNVTGAEAYSVRYRKTGMNPWTITSSPIRSKKLTGLSANTEYEWSVKSLCNVQTGLSSDWSATQNFTTKPLRLEDDSEGEIFVEVFPNPASTTIHLQLPSTPATITVFNLLGEKVREEKVSLPAGQAGGGEITMDVSELPAGLYFVRTEEAMVGKFVKLACR
ncbi:MAG: T9SS type A sorting domain-containing protein [Chitinophagales bacterium]|nr:T9SS type A sorting domain-containing protein [Chitinophagales bacterium]